MLLESGIYETVLEVVGLVFIGVLSVEGIRDYIRRTLSDKSECKKTE